MMSSRKVQRKSSITYEGEIPEVSRDDATRLPSVVRFEEYLRSTDVEIGATAYFECKIRGNPFPDITWFKNGFQLDVPSDRIWTETLRDGRHTLVIQKVKSDDSGSYRCTAINKLGRDSSMALLRIPHNLDTADCGVDNFKELSVLQTGRYSRTPNFVVSPQSIAATCGDKVNFCCEVDGHPPITVDWYRESVNLSITGRHSVKSSAGKSSLHIGDLSSDDSAIYECVASNKFGNSSFFFELAVTGDNKSITMTENQEPSFVLTLQGQKIRVGDRVRMECKVDGKPKPLVSWSKDGKFLKSSSRSKITEVFGNHSLVIFRAEAQDSGLYSLTATNQFGSKSSSAELEVEGAFGAVRSPSLTSLKSIDKAFANRRVTGSASPFQANLKSSMRGSGQPRKRGPGFILRPRPQNISSGERLSLKCTLLGHPKPTVTWTKDGELVDEDRTHGHVITRNDGNDYFLEIEEVTTNDAGKYTVNARNSLGKQTAFVEVCVTGSDSSVKAPPQTTATAAIPSTNGTVSSPNDPVNHNQQSSLGSSASEDERKSSRTNEQLSSSHLKSDSSRDSTASSISSTMSSRSRQSSSSTTSRHDVDTDDRLSSRLGRRKQFTVAPSFIRRLSSTQVLEGDELLLQCEVSGDPEPRMIWKRNGTEVGVEEDEVFTSYREGVARLRLRDAQSLHAGEYVCMARNDAGSVQCSSRVTVKAKRLEKQPRFKKSPSDVRTVEGETLTLEAEVEGVPTPEIVWSLDGEEILNGDVSYQNNVARLILHNVTPATSGQYMCNALNSCGEDSVACRVRVKAKKTDSSPIFTSSLSDVTIEESNDIVLRCTVSGNPPPSMQWKCDDEILDDGDGITNSFDSDVAILRIEQSTEEDSGVYSCTATNSEGSTSTRCNVTVTKSRKPEKKSAPTSAPKFLSTFDEYIRTQEGDTLELECEVTGNPPPEVKWLMDDKEVENSSTRFENGQAHIVIAPITSNHGSRIKCVISNSVGVKAHEARVYVRSKRIAPVFETTLPETITLHDGEETYFECKVTGHPQPRVSWTRDGRSLSVLSTQTTYEDGVAAVRIRKAGPREAGRYVCVARNLSGEAESVCVIRYVEAAKEPRQKGPVFTSTMKDVTLQDGQDLQLECRVDGDPVPSVTWELDGQTIEPEEGDIRYENGVASLVLEDAMPEDSGEYTCIATNSEGKATCSCRVTVQEAKKIEPVKPIMTKTEPSFPVVLDDITIKEGEDILLSCHVAGNPRPTIRWLLDGDELTDAEIKYDEDGAVELLLKDAVPDDEGVYTCIAESPLKRVMTSCRVSIDALPRVSKKKGSAAKKQIDSNKADTGNSAASPVESKPSFIQPLKDVVVQDGSTDFSLFCCVAGNPTARWFVNDDEIEASEDFRLVSEGDFRKLVFSEVFPDDSGTYTCMISNERGEARSSCSVDVQEIDGEAPTFALKPKQVTVSIGGKAVFTCRVDGDPPPSVEWLFCNRPVSNDRVRVTNASLDNNYTYSLEIPQVASQDAGRYSVCCRNLLGDVTCTVSLIVDDAKRQESRKDFRDVLKKSSPVKTVSNKTNNEENLDFRSVLKKSDREPAKRSSSNEDDGSNEAETAIGYKEVLSKSVATKTLSEDERKKIRAEQKDFRDNLVRKVETKVVSQDSLRGMTSDQLDFRDEALKKKVQTKVLGQDQLKMKQAEQKDFRAETLKSKVVTNEYREELTRTKRADQKDFRNVLSSPKHQEKKSTDVIEETTIADIPRAKWKTDLDHTTVATKRSRRPGVPVHDKKTTEKEEENELEVSEEKFFRPEFADVLQDLTINDSDPFELVCKVSGNPRPEVKWLLDEEEVAPEDDIITINYEDEVCRLMVTESLPEDQGRYTCIATNEHGEASCSCYVTVLGDDLNKVPPKILSGPKDCTIKKGERLCLRCTYEGTSPLKTVWRKGRIEIISSSSCQITTTEGSSELVIGSCKGDNSGCYTLQLSNACGVDQFAVSVQVSDVPDPPGTSFTEVRQGKGIIVSWYGCSYDGGSQVTEYKLEMIKMTDSRGKGRTRWASVASTDRTSYTVEELDHNKEYKFRVSAKNKNGWSKPGVSSDPVRYLAAIENGTESTDDDEEEEFVKYEPVVLKKNEKFSSKYEIKEKLGQGRFGKVHRVVHRKSGKEFAAKIMRALKAKDRQAVALEIEIMNQLRHPKLVQLIEAYQHDREVTMVMDLVSGGELFERVIDDDFELTEAACIKYMRQICHGVKFMHDNGVIHLDLKPENIMCVDKTGTRVKLIDFGLARKFNPKDPIRVMFGTPEFVAPEVINYDAISFQTDMWSVGVICYILLSGLSPFSGDADTETLSNVTAAIWDFDDEAFDQISNDAKDFISHLLVKNLRYRYTVDQAISHTWLTKNTNRMKKSKLNTRNLRRFLARRKWQKTGNAVRALGRLATLAKLSAPKVSKSGISQRESGFLTSLRAELEREKEAEKSLPDKQKPEFIETFNDVEVIEGTAACFSCVIAGIPDPQVSWLFEGDLIKSTRRVRTSYTEDGASLMIRDASEHDDGVYTCKATNPEGEVSHSAQLIVIKM